MAQTTVTVTQPPPPPPPPPSNNLIANGDLEQGSTNAPTGWNADYWGTLNATFTYPVTGNGGGKAAQVTVTNYSSGDAKWWFNHIPVSSHTIYQYSEDYNANVTTNVTIEFRLSNGNFDYEWLANEPSTGGAWKSFTAQVTVPTNAVSFTILHSLIGNGTLTIDNASLTPVQNQFPEGMVTLVFDDNLVSQYNNARPILNAAGVKATYAIITQAVRDISGDTATMTWAQITTLKNESNEIDAHTRTHPDLTTLSSSQAQTEIQGSYSDLIAQNFSPKTFVYPFGGVNSSIEQLVRNVGFTGARGSYWGLNTPTADRFALYDIRFDRATSAAKINSFIDQAKADKRWLIIELHDVKSLGGDEYTITPTKLQTVVNYIKSTGIKAVTLQDGMALMQSN
jgi:peptidoglycan/xylan/chitin deacetylase (PgdA/CDA1 family)